MSLLPERAAAHSSGAHTRSRRGDHGRLPSRRITTTDPHGGKLRVVQRHVESLTGFIQSYPPIAGLALHSLAELTDYRCVECTRTQQAAVAATLDGGETERLICPECYARLSYGHRAPVGANA